MKFFVRGALSGAIRMLIGNDWWDKVRDTVTEVSKADVPSDEKRAMVVSTLRAGGWVLAGWVLNLAIEIAVAILLKKASDLEQ